MDKVSFPPMRQLVKLEQALAREDLSLQDIEEIEQQIMVQTTDKTRDFAIGLINRAESKKPELIARQVYQIDKTRNPLDKLKLLTPLIGYLEPREVGRRFDAIEMDASLSSNKKVREAVQKQLKPLRFAENKPLVKDLDGFIARTREISSRVQKMNSLAPLQEFNTAQLKEVSRYSRRVGA